MLFFIFWPCLEACGIIVTQLGIEATPLALQVQSPNHWTTREVLGNAVLRWSLWVHVEKEMATHSSILAWRIPWTEEPGVLWSMGSRRVGHDRVTNALWVHVE